MSDLLELAGTILIGAALVFVFQGEPDLFDKWHAAAMRAAEPKQECK